MCELRRAETTVPLFGEPWYTYEGGAVRTLTHDSLLFVRKEMNDSLAVSEKFAIQFAQLRAFVANHPQVEIKLLAAVDVGADLVACADAYDKCSDAISLLDCKD